MLVRDISVTRADRLAESFRTTRPFFKRVCEYKVYGQPAVTSTRLKNCSFPIESLKAPGV